MFHFVYRFEEVWIKHIHIKIQMKLNFSSTPRYLLAVSSFFWKARIYKIYIFQKARRNKNPVQIKHVNSMILYMSAEKSVSLSSLGFAPKGKSMGLQPEVPVISVEVI